MIFDKPHRYQNNLHIFKFCDSVATYMASAGNHLE